MTEISRRSFLGAAGAGALALGLGGALPSVAAAKGGAVADNQIGTQLYTCTAAGAVAMPTTLKVIKQIGYAVVEHAGFGSAGNAKAFRAALDDAGLVCLSGHMSIPHPFDEKAFRATVEDALTAGQKYLVNPSISGLTTVKDWEAYAKTLNKAGKLAKKMGLTSIGHHNHTGEFAALPGSTLRPIDIYLRQTDPALVQPEIDLGWAYTALKSVEAVQAFLRTYPGRFSQFHVKDIRNGSPVQPGTGEIGKAGFQALFATAKQTRQPIRAYHIEDDTAVATCVDAEYTGYQMLHGMTF